MILEHKDELNKLYEYDEWVVHPVYLDNRYHPAENRISCLYIINIIQWESYIIPIEHHEKLGDIQLTDVFDYFEENEMNTYVYDKKSVINHISDYNNLYDIELLYFLNNDNWNYRPLFEDYYRKWDEFEKINTIIPLSILYDRLDEFYYDDEDELVKLIKYRSIKREKSYKNYNEVIHAFHNIELNGICKNGKIKYTQYHPYTSTGRPSNAFGGINYAALNKSDDTRLDYISRFEDGKLSLCDYTAFHPTIIINYLKIAKPDRVSAHSWLGKQYFGTDDLTDKQYDDGKSLTFFYLYGDNILHEDVKDISFYQKVAKFKRTLRKKKVIETPIFKRNLDISDMGLSKKFNYFLQAFETEINVVKIKKLNKYLEDKKSVLCLYIFDAFLFDVHPDEEYILSDIKNILESGGFPVSIKSGKNYKDME